MFRNIKIIDSYSFLAMALAEFPKTFGINELKKGFFPHKFNQPTNQNYIGSYPSVDYYQSEFFSVKKKKEFDQWYESVKNNLFDFQKEFKDYFFDQYGQTLFSVEDMSKLLKYYNDYQEEKNKEEADKEKEGEGGEEAAAEDPLAGLEDLPTGDEEAQKTGA